MVEHMLCRWFERSVAGRDDTRGVLAVEETSRAAGVTIRIDGVYRIVAVVL